MTYEHGHGADQDCAGPFPGTSVRSPRTEVAMGNAEAVPVLAGCMDDPAESHIVRGID